MALFLIVYFVYSHSQTFKHFRTFNILLQPALMLDMCSYLKKMLRIMDSIFAVHTVMCTFTGTCSKKDVVQHIFIDVCFTGRLYLMSVYKQDRLQSYSKRTKFHTLKVQLMFFNVLHFHRQTTICVHLYIAKIYCIGPLHHIAIYITITLYAHITDVFAIVYLVHMLVCIHYSLFVNTCKQQCSFCTYMSVSQWLHHNEHLITRWLLDLTNVHE